MASLEELYVLELKRSEIVRHLEGLAFSSSYTRLSGSIQMLTVDVLCKEKDDLKEKIRNQETMSRPWRTISGVCGGGNNTRKLAICTQMDFIISTDQGLPCISTLLIFKQGCYLCLSMPA